MNPIVRTAAFSLLLGNLLAVCSPAAEAADGRASQYYEDALQRYEKKDFAGAVIQLRNALRLDSKALPVHVLLGKTLLAKGEVGPAEVEFSTALSLGVNRAEVVLPMADAITAQGKQPDLLSQPRFALTDLPPAIKQQLLIRKAKAQSDTGDNRAALQSLEQARAVDPQVADPWMEEVPIRIRSRQFQEGELAASKAIALAPASADAWYHKGALAHARANLTDARQAYEKAIGLNPDHLESRIALIGLFVDGNDVNAASAALAELSKSAPREPRGVYLKALLAEKAGKTTVAAAALREVTALLDPVPLAFFRYRPQFLMLGGLAHYGLGEREKAKPYLLLAQKNHANNSVSKLLANIYISEKNFGEAIESLESYLRSTPGDVQAYSLLAAAEMGAGHPGRATQRLKQALAQSDTPALRAQLGRSLVAMGKPQDAIQELEAVYKRDPTQTATAAGLVMLYLQGNNAQKARQIAEQLVKRDAKNAGYLNLLGISQASLGDAAGARRSFEAASSLDPKFNDPVINLAKLDIGSGALDKAAGRLNQVLKVDDKNVDAMLQAASLATQKNDVAQATRWLQKAADVSSTVDLRAALALVDYHLIGRRLPAAAEALKSLEAKAPEDIRTLQAAARVRLAQGDKAAAKTVLSRASSALGPGTSASKFLEIALLQLAAEDIGGASKTVDKALAEDPGNVYAQEMQVDILVRGKAFDKAETLAQKVALANPKLAFAQAVVGDVAIARQQWAPAAAAYRKALQLEPNAHAAQRLFRTLGATPETTGEAMSFARQWLKSHANDLGMRRLVGDSLARSKDFKGARVEYEAVLKLAPRDLEATNNLVNVLILLKDPGALVLAEQALKQHPEAPSLIGSAGWAAFHAGKADRALELLRNARLRDPADLENRYMLAKVLSSLGKNDEARLELDGALTAGRTFEHEAEAKELRATLR